MRLAHSPPRSASSCSLNPTTPRLKPCASITASSSGHEPVRRPDLDPPRHRRCDTRLSQSALQADNRQPLTDNQRPPIRRPTASLGHATPAASDQSRRGRQLTTRQPFFSRDGAEIMPTICPLPKGPGGTRDFS
jgi:hypothetical protein